MHYHFPLPYHSRLSGCHYRCRKKRYRRVPPSSPDNLSVDPLANGENESANILVRNPTFDPTTHPTPTHTTLRPTKEPALAPTDKPSASPVTENPTPKPSPLPSRAPITASPSATPTTTETTQSQLATPERGRNHYNTEAAIHAVLDTDTILVRPDGSGPIVAPITAYTMRKEKISSILSSGSFELPLYMPEILNRATDAYWNWLVDELLLARVDAVMLHGRGCYELEPTKTSTYYMYDDESDYYKGTGYMCPRWLEYFRDAVVRAGAADVIKVGFFDPMDHYQRDVEYGEGVEPLPFDMSNPRHWKYVWDHNIKIFFDIIPKRMWYLREGKPIISTWQLQDERFSNVQGNASKMIRWIKEQFREEYGMEPIFVIQKSWMSDDSTITPDLVEGMHSWFAPKLGYLHSETEYNGKKYGVVGPGYRKVKSDNFNGGNRPGCGDICREVKRRNGFTLIDGFEANRDSELILLEGWTNVSENNGYYRSEDPAWDYPSQYIDIVRRYADPAPATLKFQAEGADRFYDTTLSNLGGNYANRALDVAALDDGTGWYVGWVEAGEWLEYQKVELGCGTYRFTARASAFGGGGKILLDLGLPGPGLQSVKIPNTGGYQNFELFHLGEIQLDQGSYDLKIRFETAGVNLDWFFVKRVETCNE